MSQQPGTDDQKQATARRFRQLAAQVSRTNPSEFCAFVLRDEETGLRIRQAPMHQRWHELITAHDRLVIWSHVEGGKTNQIALGRALYELGKNPNLRIAIVSNTSDMAKKMVRQVGQYVEKSIELREVFPNLRPTHDPSLPWTAMSLTVDRGRVGAKDPSVQACGVHGNIMGSRIDLLIIDDILDYENTRTPTPREDVWRWVRSSLFSRLTKNARVIVVGNAWHPEDLLHRLAREPDFKGYRFPVIDKAGNLTWPERWPKERIEKSRRDLGPLEFARQLLCMARDDDTARFRREWIDVCRARGRGMFMVDSARSLYAALLRERGYDPAPLGIEAIESPDTFRQPNDAIEAAETIYRLGGNGFEYLQQNDEFWFLRGIRFYTGVDLAVQKHDAADLSVIFTIAVFPNGDRRVCEILSGRWGSPDIVSKIIDVYRRFGSIVIVENVGAQDYIVQFVRERSAATVVPFTTGRTKAHPEFGIEGLAAEFAAGKWMIPTIDGQNVPEVDAWISELLFYDPMAHTGDRVMAGWFAREGARSGDVYAGAGSVDVRVFTPQVSPVPTIEAQAELVEVSYPSAYEQRRALQRKRRYCP